MNIRLILGMLITGVLLILTACMKEIPKESAVVETKVVETKAKEPQRDIAKENLDFVKAFYTEYIGEVGSTNTNLDNVAKIKEKYVGDVMRQEMEFRSREADADMYLHSQDPTGMLDRIKFENGKDSSWVKVSYSNKDEFEDRYTEINLHVTEKNGKKYIDTIDSYESRKSSDGKKDEFTYTTKYGNKEVLTDQDKKEIADKIEYFKKCDEEGYIS